jgi:hypothetical protein
MVNDHLGGFVAQFKPGQDIKDVQTRLDSLPSLDNAALRVLWGELFQIPLPPKIRKNLLVRVLAYRIQENSYGGLSAASQNRLRQLAKMFEADRNATVPDIPIFKPGTRIVREWKGQIHQVTIGSQDYEYRGTRYKSLSEIARRITGTRWSGPSFFGLKKTGIKEKTNQL